MPEHLPLITFPPALTDYPANSSSLLETLAQRAHAEPFNLIATGIFAIAVLHTFVTSWFRTWADKVQQHHDATCRRQGVPSTPSVAAELLHFLGEVEAVFGLWAAVLLAALTMSKGWETANHYFSQTVEYTEPVFVVVIMALASTRPIIVLAERVLGGVASFGRDTPAAWWATILTVGPLLGSLITEPAAMTICALVLGRQFYDLNPSTRLKYSTLGLLFVNVSIGGTLTHFAAPPVLMVARPWGWDTAYMLSHFGWRATAAIVLSTGVYLFLFRQEFRTLRRAVRVPDVEVPAEGAEEQRWSLLPVPGWLIAAHAAFMGWTVFTSHYPALVVGGFLFFLGFARATAAYQSRFDLRPPLLVGFFLAGLVIHGRLQGWWIAPVLSGLTAEPLFASSTLLTAFNDNALITYLATLVPSLDDQLKAAIVEGAVTGGGLTVIANAPNPAGQALLSRFFGGAVSPVGLLAGALIPTLVAVAMFRLL